MDPNFNGTSLSAEHIGQKQSDNLAAFISNPETEYALIRTSVSAEVANAITVNIQLANLGNNKILAQAVKMKAVIRDSNFVEALVGAATIDLASGTLISPDTQPALYFETDANGAAELVVTDVTAALAGDLHLELSVQGREGGQLVKVLTFA